MKKLISLNEFKNNDSVGDISKVFGKFFEIRDQVHSLHLQTKSYSEHKALDSFYKDFLEIVDQFCETYMGQYGLVKFTTTSTKETTPIEYLEEVVEFLGELHEKLGRKDTHLHNIVDEMMALTYQTLYKLKFLK